MEPAVAGTKILRGRRVKQETKMNTATQSTTPDVGCKSFFRKELCIIQPNKVSDPLNLPWGDTGTLIPIGTPPVSDHIKPGDQGTNRHIIP